MTSLVIGLILLSGGLRVWLNVRQHACMVRQRSKDPPAWSDAASVSRAIDGALGRVRIAVLGVLAETALALLLAAVGIEAMVRAGRSLDIAPIALAITPAALVLLSMGTIRTAVEAANVFVVDASLGLGKPAVPLFLADAGKKLVVASVLMLPLLAAVAVLIESDPRLWWLLAWALWLGAVAFELCMRPTIEMRMLHSASRLHDPQLEARIAHLLKQCGLRLGQVRVLDASRRTRRANASVQGIGRLRHILLHDTLFERLDHGAILAVIAHEAGHVRMQHLLRYLAALAGLGLAAAAGFAVLRTHLGTSTAQQLAMIVLLAKSGAIFLRPLVTGLARRFEYEADAFAAAQVGAPALIRALERLYAVNANVAAGDRLHALFYATHPAPRERLARLRILSRDEPIGTY